MSIKDVKDEFRNAARSSALSVGKTEEGCMQASQLSEDGQTTVSSVYSQLLCTSLDGTAARNANVMTAKARRIC
jgi:hypothetical protein